MGKSAPKAPSPPAAIPNSVITPLSARQQPENIPWGSMPMPTPGRPPVPPASATFTPRAMPGGPGQIDPRMAVEMLRRRGG